MSGKRRNAPFCANSVVIKEFVSDLSEFGQVASGQIIVIFQNDGKQKENLISTKKGLDGAVVLKPQGEVTNPDYNIQGTFNDSILTKLSLVPKLKNVLGIKITTGVQVGGVEVYKGIEIKEHFYREKWDKKHIFPSVKTKTVQRYSVPEFERGILFDYTLATKITKNTEKSAVVLAKYRDFLEREKIFVRQSASSIIATLGAKKVCAEYSVFSILTDAKVINLQYLLGLLNSKLMTYFAKKCNVILAESGTQPQIRKNGLERLPIFPATTVQQKPIIVLVDRMLSLNKELREAPEHSDKWERIKSDIEKTDRKIDAEVYKLYGLTAEEIGVVEGNG